MRTVMILIVVVLALMAYIRLSPTDPERWHVAPDGSATGDETGEGSFKAVRRTTAPDHVVLEILYDTARAAPRTRLIAGSVSSGMMTFETRSKIWGFPDYTTITINDDMLIVYGRLRFGRGDMGVNKARIENWLTAVAPLTAKL